MEQAIHKTYNFAGDFKGVLVNLSSRKTNDRVASLDDFSFSDFVLGECVFVAVILEAIAFHYKALLIALVRLFRSGDEEISTNLFGNPVIGQEEIPNSRDFLLLVGGNNAQRRVFGKKVKESAVSNLFFDRRLGQRLNSSDAIYQPVCVDSLQCSSGFRIRLNNFWKVFYGFFNSVSAVKLNKFLIVHEALKRRIILIFHRDIIPRQNEKVKKRSASWVNSKNGVMCTDCFANPPNGNRIRALEEMKSGVIKTMARQND